MSNHLRAMLHGMPRAHAVAHAVKVRWIEHLRRSLHPERFKETYINRALVDRPHPTTYLEIGVRDGVSLRAARADRKIAIDPCRLRAMSTLRKNEEFFQSTSDDFFAVDAKYVLRERSVDVALIDGLHEFTQVLRDITNLEPYMRPDGIVFFDDCNPLSAERAAPVKQMDIPWNGDVWKIGPYLANERPGLRFTTLDADQGVGVVTGFSGGPGRGLDDRVVRRYADLDYGYLAANRREVLNLVPPSQLTALLEESRSCRSSS